MKRLIALALALGALGACGVQGPLERPAPLFGEDRRQWEAEQARIAAEAAARAEADRAARGETPAPDATTQPVGTPIPQ